MTGVELRWLAGILGVQHLVVAAGGCDWVVGWEGPLIMDKNRCVWDLDTEKKNANCFFNFE